MVALRKESVDRNHTNVLPSVEVKPSLSARRAWIEIGNVAFFKILVMSLSARRAWIEISGTALQTRRKRSLSARRAWIEILP